jgi:DNA mismatch repair protein MutL
MYLIDQHAAHERIVFEKVKEEAESRTSEAQSLLEPVSVDLDPRQEELWAEQQDLIARLGFLVEPFGPQTYLIRGVPAHLADGNPGEKLRDVLDSMAEGGGFEAWIERAAYSVACHGAIRAGKILSREEMSELARGLEECDQPSTCPHGRPTMIHLSSSHLEREFGRR